MPSIPEDYWVIIWKAIASLVVLALTLVANRATRTLVRKRVKEPAHGHTLRMLLRNTVLFAGTAAILLIWLGFGSNFTVAMGLLGAGIAFASQEVIGSFAGYVNIVTGSLFHIGDRVRIGDVVGDVLDITILRTTLMEIGEWVKADQYTGRFVSVANRVVFSDPVYNYSRPWPYLWDDITIPITYSSNWRRATEIMLSRAREYCAECQDQAQEDLGRLMAIYPVDEAPVQPMIYTTLTDNWIQMSLRYVVEARRRREMQGRLHRELLERFEEDPEITVASATFEIVGFPPLRREDSPIA